MPHEQGPRRGQAQLLAELARELQGATGEGDTAQSITDRAAALVPDADWVSLTVRARRGRWLTLATTDPRATRADELHYALRAGPCVDAAEVDVAMPYAAHVSVALTSAREVSGLHSAVHSRHLMASPRAS